MQSTCHKRKKAQWIAYPIAQVRTARCTYGLTIVAFNDEWDRSLAENPMLPGLALLCSIECARAWVVSALEEAYAFYKKEEENFKNERERSLKRRYKDVRHRRAVLKRP